MAKIKIKFLTDYADKIIQYKAGDIAIIEESKAKKIVSAKHAESLVKKEK